MNETPEQRRTRLIEQYIPIYLRKECAGTHQDIILMLSETMADAVIAATPQAQEPGMRYPSEIETRLIELLDQILGQPDFWERFPSSLEHYKTKLSCIKFDLAQI